MTGKCYYLTTLGAWQRHASRFANSHWIALNAPANSADVARARHAVPGPHDSARPDLGATDAGGSGAAPTREQTAPSNNAFPVSRPFVGALRGAPDSASAATPSDKTPILVLVEADEGVHLALEDDATFEALPHPLAQKPISKAAQAALAARGVSPGATTFDVAEAVARAHPLLRHRVF